MSKSLKNHANLNAFLATPRLAMLLYNGSGPAPTGVPVWFDWDSQVVRMFAGRNSPKITHLREDPNISVLVTNLIGEAEGWVAFDGSVTLGEYTTEEWTTLIDRMAPRYWDLSDEYHAKTIEQWREMPEAFISLELRPTKIRSGA